MQDKSGAWLALFNTIHINTNSWDDILNSNSTDSARRTSNTMRVVTTLTEMTLYLTKNNSRHGHVVPVTNSLPCQQWSEARPMILPRSVWETLSQLNVNEATEQMHNTTRYEQCGSE